MCFRTQMNCPEQLKEKRGHRNCVGLVRVFGFRQGVVESAGSDMLLGDALQYVTPDCADILTARSSTRSRSFGPFLAPVLPPSGAGLQL